MPPSKATKATRPASLACLECRHAHLKCDGAVPVCARCSSRGFACSYAASQRGRRRGMKYCGDATNKLALLSYLSPPSGWIADRTPDPEESTAGTGTVAPTGDVHSELSSMLAVPDVSNNRQMETTPQWVDDERLVNLYYLNFHINHPILVPRSLYWEREYTRPLKAVVEFIGSHFLATPPNHDLQEDVVQELESGLQDTPEIVQARLLYASLLLARNHSPQCQTMLASAVGTALRLGMHRREFAASLAKYQAVEEESMRRTWYELYVIDGCVAAFQRKSHFRTSTIDADVALPCEESLYEEGMFLPSSVSRDDFESSVFAEEETVFSSFTYRVEAVRLLGRVLIMTGEHGVAADQVQAADNALAAFLHHLPATKREPEIVNTFGDVDQLMFQTHAIVQYATILLHFPRGDLASPGPIATELPGDGAAKFVCPCTRQQVHSIKAIEGSKAISMLAAFRIPAQRHSPLFIYPLTLAAVVQLSVCLVHAQSPNLCWEQHRDRIKLILGMLRSLSRNWSIAGAVLRVLKKVALKVFKPSRSGMSDPTQSQHPMDDSSYSRSPAMTGEITIDDLDLHNLNEFLGLDTDVFCF